MRFFTISVILFFTFKSYTQNVLVTGSTAADGNYATLSAAFTAIGTIQTGNNILISIVNNTTEPATGATLGAGDWASLVISPTSNWTISGAVTAGNPLITFNGADNVTINGNLNLTLSNTTVSSSSGTSTVRLLNDANNNIFNQVIILGSSTGTGGANTANVWLSTAASSGTGNDNNIFTGCKLGPAGTNLPAQLFLNNGTNTTVGANSNLTINNCEFYDYFHASSTQSAFYSNGGIGVGFTFTNNKIYQTSTRTTTGIVYGVNLLGATVAESVTIAGNTIGGNDANGNGTMTYNANTTTSTFVGINFSLLTSSITTSNISNNTIKNVTRTSTTNAATFSAISNSQTSTASTNTINIQNNSIKKITVASSGMFTGMNVGGAGTLNVSGNHIDSIYRYTGTGSSAAAPSNLITFTGGVTTNINNNTISNFTFETISTNGATWVITDNATIHPSTLIVVENNTIKNFIIKANGALSWNGIYFLTTTLTGTRTVRANIITNIFYPNSLTGIVYGLRSNGGLNVNFIDNTIDSIYGGLAIAAGIWAQSGTNYNISGNRIFHLNTIGTNSVANGIQLNGGTNMNAYNNFISDIRNTNGGSNGATALNGINITGGSNVNVYFNTIYLGNKGVLTNNTGIDFGGSGILLSSATPITSIKNNIININAHESGDGYFAPFRTTAGLSLVNITASNNIYYNSGKYIFGQGTYKSTATNLYYKAVSGFTGTADPLFNSTCGGLYKTFMNETGTYWENNLVNGAVAETYTPAGTSYAAEGATTVLNIPVNVDYNNTLRSITPDIGALEFVGIKNMDYSSNSLAGIIGGTQVCRSLTVTPINGDFYQTIACDLIAKVVPSGSTPVTGSVDGCVKIETTAPLTLASVKPYLRRHFDITPSTSAGTATATVTLYVTQADFDDYNTNNGVFADLPNGPTDLGGIANLVVSQFHGPATGTGLPDSYNIANEEVIFVDDSKIVWNAEKQWWEITFDVNGFSGFFIHSIVQGLLPVKFENIKAVITGATNTVSWKTLIETNIQRFIIERSLNGTSYTKIGEVATQAMNGNSSIALQYSFKDISPVLGKQFYRLQIVENDGKTTFSQIVKVQRRSNKIEIVDVRPNPTTSIVYFNVLGTSTNVNVAVRDLSGKEVIRKGLVQSNSFSIDLSKLANGMYILEAVDVRSGEKAMFKVMKQ